MALNFFRMNYADEQALEKMRASRTLDGAHDQDVAALAARLSIGDHVLAGRYLPDVELGHVRLIGRVKAMGAEPEIIWVPADLKLRPRSLREKVLG